MGLKPYIIGIGGRAGAGKSYVSTELFRMLEQVSGKTTVSRMKFAAPLKSLVKDIISECTGVYTSMRLDQYTEGDLKEVPFPVPIDLGPDGVECIVVESFAKLANVPTNHHSVMKLRNMLEHQRPQMETPRALMQYLGTECGRDCFYPDFWVHLAFKRYEDWCADRARLGLPPLQYVIFDDVRFYSERIGIRTYEGTDTKSLLVAIARDSLDTLFADSEGAHVSESSYGTPYEYDLRYAVASGDLEGLRSVAGRIRDHIIAEQGEDDEHVG